MVIRERRMKEFGRLHFFKPMLIILTEKDIMGEVRKIMAGVTELNTKIQEVLDTVNSERAQVSDAVNNLNLAIEDLKAQLEALQLGQDLQPQVDALEAVRNQISGIYNPT